MLCVGCSFILSFSILSFSGISILNYCLFYIYMPFKNIGTLNTVIPIVLLLYMVVLTMRIIVMVKYDVNKNMMLFLYCP